MDLSRNFRWHGPAVPNSIQHGRVEMTTLPHTDLWQRTYYHFRNDNAPMLLFPSSEKFFSFTVKTEYNSKHRFDQCGVVIYLDSENWLKASAEYHDAKSQHLGSVVTNNGYSDWATSEIPASIRAIWYRLSRREDDFRIETSLDSSQFSQMRICHLWEAQGEISLGVYACSPEESSFTAVFSDFAWSECKWAPHDGQPPDE